MITIFAPYTYRRHTSIVSAATNFRAKRNNAVVSIPIYIQHFMPAHNYDVLSVFVNIRYTTPYFVFASCRLAVLATAKDWHLVRSLNSGKEPGRMPLRPAICQWGARHAHTQLAAQCQAAGCGQCNPPPPPSLLLSWRSVQVNPMVGHTCDSPETFGTSKAPFWPSSCPAVRRGSRKNGRRTARG